MTAGTDSINQLFSVYSSSRNTSAKPINWKAVANMEFVSNVPWNNPFIVNPNNLNTTIICYILLGCCFGVLLLLVGTDMYRKQRTGELHESMHNLGHMIQTVFVLPTKAFRKKALEEPPKAVNRKSHKMLQSDVQDEKSGSSSDQTADSTNTANESMDETQEAQHLTGTPAINTHSKKRNSPTTGKHQIEELNLGSPLMSAETKEVFFQPSRPEAARLPPPTNAQCNPCDDQ